MRNNNKMIWKQICKPLPAESNKISATTELQFAIDDSSICDKKYF